MISILMPLYNGIEFINESVSSVINQTYKQWELLIGINGYNEKEYEVLSRKVLSFAGDVRIKTFHYAQRSKTKTLNCLATEAKYDYITLIDVDDVWMPYKLSEQLAYINQYDVIGSDCIYFGDHEGSPGLFLGKLSPIMFSYQNPVVNSTVMMKKQDAIWDETWEGLDDYHLWIDLLNHGKTFYNVNKILIKHRIHNEAFFNNKNNDMADKLRESIPKMTIEQYEQLGVIMDNKRWEL